MDPLKTVIVWFQGMDVNVLTSNTALLSMKYNDMNKAQEQSYKTSHNN